MRISSLRRAWPLVGALIGALAVTSVSGAGHDATNVFHLGATNVGTGTTTLQTNINSTSLAITNTNTGSSAGAVAATSTSTAAAVLGTTNSTLPAAVAIRGLVASDSANSSSVAVHGRNEADVGGTGVQGTGGDTGVGAAGAIFGVEATSSFGTGVRGTHVGVSGTGPGVHGQSGSAAAGARAVYGELTHAAPAPDATSIRGHVTGNQNPFNGYGVWGSHGAAGIGVRGTSSTGTGVQGLHEAVTGIAPGVQGTTNSAGAGAAGVRGTAAASGPSGDTGGVEGFNFSTSALGFGVHGDHLGSGKGVFGQAFGGTGVEGAHASSTGAQPGVHGRTNSSSDLAAGVFGEAPSGSLTAGVYGSSSAFGVLGIGAAAGVVGYNPPGLAGYFIGNVAVTGTLTKGAGAFRIDHPLEPETKYLQHSFVESPDMKNVYDGVVRTDLRGFATVRLPRYFSSLNRDFRYQLTLLGKAAWGAQAIVWEKIRGNQFVIRSRPHVEVSWQVTGIRKDTYANANRIDVEITKTAADRRTAALPARLLRARK